MQVPRIRYSSTLIYTYTLAEAGPETPNFLPHPHPQFLILDSDSVQDTGFLTLTSDLRQSATWRV